RRLRQRRPRPAQRGGGQGRRHHCHQARLNPRLPRAVAVSVAGPFRFNSPDSPITNKPVIPNGFASQLFPTLVTAFAPSDHRPLRVLDLGPASAATVAFFSQYRCTLRFADLNPGELMPPPGDDGEVPDRDAHLRRLLELPL